jgi:hypothetical protein
MECSQGGQPVKRGWKKSRDYVSRSYTFVGKLLSELLAEFQHLLKGKHSGWANKANSLGVPSCSNLEQFKWLDHE